MSKRKAPSKNKRNQKRTLANLLKKRKLTNWQRYQIKILKERTQ